MKKNILIIILLLVTSLSILYGYIKAKEAELNLVRALEYKESAQLAEEEAKRQMDLATMAAADARAAQAEAERVVAELVKCQSN